MALRLFCLLFVAFATTVAAAAPARAADAVMSVDPAVVGPRVPDRLVGLSVETSVMPRIGRYASRGNLVPLMRSLGPGVLRIGGNSVDIDTAWDDGTTRRPAWAQETIGPTDLKRLGRLARRTGWKVFITAGLGHPNPHAAARYAWTAKVALGDNLAGVAIGNEPDDYVRKGLRPAGWTFDDYVEEVAATARAIRSAVPRIPIIGPDNGLRPDWFSSAASALRPNLLAWHHYPLSGCGTPQTLEALLDAATRDKQARTLSWLAGVGAGAGLPVRLTEVNSIGCGGQNGVSNSQGSALWAVDLLVRAVENGIVGVDFHGAPGRCFAYSPACTPTDKSAAKGRVHVRPLWYALLLARQIKHDRLIGSRLDSGLADVDATAFRTARGGMHILAVNRTGRAVYVRLRVGATVTTGDALHLRAASVTAKRGVTLGGRRVGRAGRWRPGSLPRVRVADGKALVRVPAGAATLVRLPARPGAANGAVAARRRKAKSSTRAIAHVTRVVASRHLLRVGVACPRARRWCSARIVAAAGSRAITGRIAMRGGTAKNVTLRAPRAVARAARVSVRLTDAGRHVRVRRSLRSSR